MAKTFKELMQEARSAVPEWAPDEVKSRMSNGGGYTVLDVREKEEYRDGHLPGAISVPRGFLDQIGLDPTGAQRLGGRGGHFAVGDSISQFR